MSTISISCVLGKWRLSPFSFAVTQLGLRCKNRRHSIRKPGTPDIRGSDSPVAQSDLTSGFPLWHSTTLLHRGDRNWDIWNSSADKYPGSICCHQPGAYRASPPFRVEVMFLQLIPRFDNRSCLTQHPHIIIYLLIRQKSTKFLRSADLPQRRNDAKIRKRFLFLSSQRLRNSETPSQ
jgi:hypothetical protein